MFASAGFTSDLAHTRLRPAANADALPQALSLFSEMSRAAGRGCRLPVLCRQPRRAAAPVIERGTACVPNRHYAGLRSVPIDRIRRNAARSRDFDDAFHPLHARMLSRWLNVATGHLAGANLGPVALILSDGVYVVQDGHHRVSVAAALGEVYVDAEVIEEIC